MQDLDNLTCFFFICAEFEVKKKTSVSGFYKENNFKPCLTKQLSCLKFGVCCSAISENSRALTFYQFF